MIQKNEIIDLNKKRISIFVCLLLPTNIINYRDVHIVHIDT